MSRKNTQKTIASLRFVVHSAAEAAVRKELTLWEDRRRALRASINVVVASTLVPGARPAKTTHPEGAD